MNGYRIFTDATADTCREAMAGLPKVEVIPMEVEVDGWIYTYGPGGNISVEDFYRLQRAGKFASTTQINPQIYFDAFTPVLERGEDILYLCFTSGMSGTCQTAQSCVRALRAQFPAREIRCIDTLCASAGEGFLVREAARMQGEGLSLEELYDWVMAHRLEVCHWFTVDTFTHLRHGGRVSSAAAAMGTMMQIKPLLHVDEQGRLEVAEKPRGRKRAMEAQLARMEQGWRPDRGKTVFICHGDNPEGAALLRKEVSDRFPEAELYDVDIGPVIGAHTGPGMLALIFWGTSR